MVAAYLPYDTVFQAARTVALTVARSVRTWAGFPAPLAAGRTLFFRSSSLHALREVALRGLWFTIPKVLPSRTLQGRYDDANTTCSSHLPIEAFFYISGYDGPMDAMSYQRDFYDTTGRWVPVIRLTMASSPGARATFTYRLQDQAIS
jgi:hypothetical protein